MSSRLEVNVISLGSGKIHTTGTIPGSLRRKAFEPLRGFLLDVSAI